MADAYDAYGMSEDEAARFIQGLYRSRKARRNLRLMIASVYERVWDEGSGAYYYFNTKDGTSSWTAPACGRGADIRSPRGRLAVAQREAKKRAGTYKSAADMSEEDAARAIQGLFRSRRARFYLRQLLGELYERVWDEGSQSYYYFNKRTGASSWNAPSMAQEGDIEDAKEPTPRPTEEPPATFCHACGAGLSAGSRFCNQARC